MNTLLMISLGVYLAILVVITIFARRRETDSQFLIAGRKLSAWPLGLSLFATSVSSYNFITVTVFTIMLGIWIVPVFITFGLGLWFLVWLTARNDGEFRKRKFTTISEFFGLKFGKRAAAVTVAIIAFFSFIFIIFQLKVNTAAFSNFLEWGEWPSALLIAGVVLAYSLIGGFRVVIRTDIFQSIMMLMVLLVAIWILPQHLTLEHITAGIGDTAIIVSGISVALMQFLSVMPFNEVWQRLFAARDVPSLKKGFLLGFIMVGLVQVPTIGLGLVARAGLTTNTETAFFDMIGMTPEWMFPVVAIAFFAAFMSSLDSSLFAFATQITKPFTENSERKNTVWMRIAMIATIAVALPLALHAGSLTTATIGLMSLAIIPGLLVFLAPFLRIPDRVAATSMIVGVIVFVAMYFMGGITDDPLTSLIPVGVTLAAMAIFSLIPWMRRG